MATRQGWYPGRTVRGCALAIALAVPCGAQAVSVDPADRESVRGAYASVVQHAADVPTDWTGSSSSCTVGGESAASRAATIEAVNFYRQMNGLAPVTLASATINQKALAAAMMFEAQGALSHSPPSTWSCWTADGAQAAGESNIALGVGGADVVTAYMRDSGANNTAVGHRRWILYPRAQSFGTGSTEWANALWVFDANGNLPSGPRPPADVVAWPPPGYVPWPLVFARWSVSSNLAPSADYSQATVTVTANGASLPVTVLPLANGYGDNTIVFEVTVPSAMRTAGADTTFDVAVANVRVGGVPRTIAYRTVAVQHDLAPAPGGVWTDVTAGDATISWDAPPPSASTITGYRVALRTQAGVPVATRDVAVGVTSTTFTGLGNGVYIVDVRALTAGGPGAAASGGFAVESGVPGEEPPPDPEPGTDPDPAPGGGDEPPGRPPAALLPSPLTRVAVVRARGVHLARLSLVAPGSVAGGLQRWNAGARRWVAVRPVTRRTLAAGVRGVRLGRLAHGRYRVVITARATGRVPGRLARTFTVR